MSLPEPQHAPNVHGYGHALEDFHLVDVRINCRLQVFVPELGLDLYPWLGVAPVHLCPVGPRGVGMPQVMEGVVVGVLEEGSFLLWIDLLSRRTKTRAQARFLDDLLIAAP